MDWPRAKTVLITAFLILNVFLLVQIVNQQEARIPVGEYEQINDTIIDLLEDRYQITVSYNELPTTVPRQQTVLRWQEIDENTVLRHFWPEATYTEGGDGLYEKGEEYIQFNGERYTYWSNDPGERQLGPDSQIIDHIALCVEDADYLYLFDTSIKLALIEVLGIDFSDWILDSVGEATEGGEAFYDLTFVQDIGLPLYDAGSFTEVRITPAGRVAGVRRSLVAAEQRDTSLWSAVRQRLSLSSRRTIITSAEALLSLAGQADFEPGSSVIDMKLAYYGLSTAAAADADQPSSWEATPVYSIRVKSPGGSARSYFISPFTGEIVQ